MEEEEKLSLEKQAKKIRQRILKLVYGAQSGHPGGSLSIADIMTYLYFKELKVDPKNPNDPNRDRLVLSKGHCAPASYAALIEKGFIDESEAEKFRQVDGILQGHPDMKHTPGVDMTTGSLGQGLSAAVGMALAAKMDQKDYRVFCVLGDGELEEGQVWEAAMAAAHYKLDNLYVIIDRNNLQIDGETEKVLNPNPIYKKFREFGFDCMVVDGHDFYEISDAMEDTQFTEGMPTAIIAQTIKGKGVSFMEGKAEWHGKAPNEEEYQKALEELEGACHE